MKLLGVDYGMKKVGLALAESDSALTTFSLAEPYKVIVSGSQEETIKKISNIVKRSNIERVVVGLSEGKMAEKTRKFCKKLKGGVEVPVVFQDETMSTKDAEVLSAQANINRKKRKRLKDAYSAAIILQNYLDAEKIASQN